MKKFFIYSMILSLVFHYSGIAQTAIEKKSITKNYNTELLNDLAKSYKIKAENEKAEALKLAKQNGWPVRYEEDGKLLELMKVRENGTPVYYSTYNVNAAESSRANTMHNGELLGLNIEGQNMEAHVWDAGIARDSHQEYDGAGGNNRFSVGDGSSSLHYHSAHVTGTIMASGYVYGAKGMAPQADAIGYDWNSDLSEATSAANSGMLLSNHSYGTNIYYVDDWEFGAYISESRSWDNLLYNAPYYLMVVAAGNEGDDNSSNGNPLDGNQYYDKLNGHATSKNNMVVANAQDANINGSGDLVSVNINSGSSEGPCDDYRIKPDITGNGTSLYSTYESYDSEYASISGTSMAAPNVTGTLLLLQQYYNSLNSGYMKAATLKGLALHTADDAGPSGPDAIWGWGLINAKEAANTITDNGVNSIIDERSLSTGNSYQINVTSDGINDLIVSISWTDPPGTANSGTANDPTPALVNDLDITVTKGGTTYYPYRLTSITTNGIGDNDVDPFEKIIIGGASGTYTINVSYEGSLYSGSQAYSLIVSGISGGVVDPPVADFEADNLTPGVGQTVNFTDLSTNNPSSWSWSFNPPTVTYVGVTDFDSQNPQVQFNSVGQYTVTLTATNAYGSDTEPKTDYIDVSLYCDAIGAFNFMYISNVQIGSINNSSGQSYYADYTSMSTDLSQGATGEQISVINGNVYGAEDLGIWIDWNQDGDFYDVNENIVCEINNGGQGTFNFDVPGSATLGTTTMRVRIKYSGSDCGDPCGSATYGEVEDYSLNIVNTNPPVAEFNADDTTPDVGQTVTFSDLSTNLPTSWSWSFSPSTITYVGGTNSSSQNPQVQFNSPGNYTVELTATNAYGNDTETKINYISSAISYCDASGASSFLEITRVQLETIDNSSGQEYYGDFTYLSTDLNKNQSYDITITNDGNFQSADLGIWIDYNQDGDFDDTGENIVCDIDNYGEGTFNFSIPGTAQSGTTRMRIRTKYSGSDCGSPCGTESNGEVEDYSVNLIEGIPGLWNGNTSNDWGISSNWGDSNIPATGTDVTIPTSPSGGNFPETNSGTGAVCNNLTIGLGAHLYIPSNNTLTVNSTLTNNAGSTGLVVKSDDSGTGSLIHNTTGVNGTVERYLTDMEWHFIGIPVASASASVFHFPSGHSDIYLRTHDQATNTWSEYIVPMATPLILGRGYDTWVGDPQGIQQPETVEFEGLLNSGNYTTGAGNFYDLQYTSQHGLNLISNPYPSALFADIDTWAKNNVDNSVWIWDHAAGNYVYWNGTDDTNGYGWGTMTGGVIPSMQAFFVLANNSNPDVTIPQANRVHSSQAFYKDSYIPENTLKLEVSGNEFKDIAYVTFNQDATDEYDGLYDVKKIYGLNEAPQLYSIISGDKLSINALSEFIDYRLVNLGFECETPAMFTIEASEIQSFEESITIYLEDLKTGSIQNLNQNPAYEFAHEIGDEPGRFILHFGEPNAVEELDQNNIRIYSNKDVVYIQHPVNLKGDIIIYDLMGQEIARKNPNGKSLTTITINNGTGYYLVKIINDKAAVAEKVFIK